MSYSFQDFQNGDVPPKGWDCADAIRDGWTIEDIEGFMRATVKPWVPPAPSKAEKPVVVAPKPVAEVRSATATKPHDRFAAPVDDGWMMALVKNDKGKTMPSITKNWMLWLENHPETAGLFAWDAFKLCVTLMRRPPWDRDTGLEWTPRTLQDRDYSECVAWLEGLYLTPKASNIPAVIQTIAERHSFDRLLEYLDGLVWDGTPRVETWMTPMLGVEDTKYNRAVGQHWLVSSVARGLHPGSKVDTMPILEGPQGLNKSTAIKALYGAEFFSDSLSDIGNKDALMELQGVWGLEVAEMHGMTMAETNQVKKFLSRAIDRYRPPYGRMVIEAPRRVVMCGTINPEGNAYLRDPTGARRFWPIICGKIDIDQIIEQRNQLWAEAVHLFKSGAKWWVQPDEMEVVEAEQEKRTDIDAWTDKIAPLLRGEHLLTQVFIFEKLGILTKDLNHSHPARVGRIMKKLRWVAGRDRQNGEDCVVYRNPNNLAPEPIDGEKW